MPTFEDGILKFNEPGELQQKDPNDTDPHRTTFIRWKIYYHFGFRLVAVAVGDKFLHKFALCRSADHLLTARNFALENGILQVTAYPSQK